MDTDLDVTALKGIGPKRADALRRLGISTLDDVLNYFPRRYADLSSPTRICDLEDGVHAVVRASVVGNIKTIRSKSGIYVSSFDVSDGSGELAVVLFNQQFKVAELQSGDEYLFVGRPVRAGFFMQMSGPDIEPVSRMAILPVYALAKNIPQNRMRNIVDVVIAAVLPSLTEFLPDSTVSRLGLMPLAEAYMQIHHPRDFESLQMASSRFAFEELFLFSLGVLTVKSNRKKLSGIALKRYDISPLTAQLAFSLTAAQSRVLDECMSDMTSGNAMLRIIQGDVGSGKTVVAAALMYLTALNGMQSCLMAPTEILALQHYETFKSMLQPLGISCALLTGSVPAARRRALLASVADGTTDILIGTHALIQRDVSFARLALAVTDEQHRFGVEQRARLTEKGRHPHVLVMSATPIPRTMAMVLYGDMDVSVIDQLPPGRKKTSTFVLDSSYHERMYSYIKRRVCDGAQAYVVCPLVEDADNESIKAVEKYAEELSCEYLRGVRVGYLHGRMKSKDKEAVLHDFSSGNIQVLVSTTVIEVGVNVPSATIMVIENAERFGLSQLHQLRGRVGRGSEKAYCFVVSDSKSESAKERLEIFRTVSDGFELSRRDMQIRGPGDFLGSRQSGLPMFRHADLMRDSDAVDSAHEEAKRILQDPLWYTDPSLSKLRASVVKLFARVDFDIFS